MPRAVISILSLDVSKAFDRVSHQRLLHNLSKRKIPERIVTWVSSFLGERRTAFRLGDFTSKEEEVQMGIPQGSPLSPILYLFYSADLVGTCKRPLHNTSVIAFVDDTNIVVYGDSGKGNCQRLRAIHRHCGRWAETHGSELNVSKYQLIHLFRNRNAWGN